MFNSFSGPHRGSEHPHLQMGVSCRTDLVSSKVGMVTRCELSWPCYLTVATPPGRKGSLDLRGLQHKGEGQVKEGLRLEDWGGVLLS